MQAGWDRCNVHVPGCLTTDVTAGDAEDPPGDDWRAKILESGNPVLGRLCDEGEEEEEDPLMCG